MANIVKSPCDQAVILAGSSDHPSDSCGPWVLAATILGSSMAIIDGTGGESCTFGAPIRSGRFRLSLSNTLQLRQLTSVVRHADSRLWKAARARLTLSRMLEAFAVQMKGLGFSLWWSM